MQRDEARDALIRAGHAPDVVDDALFAHEVTYERDDVTQHELEELDVAINIVERALTRREP